MLLSKDKKKVTDNSIIEIDPEKLAQLKSSCYNCCKGFMSIALTIILPAIPIFLLTFGIISSKKQPLYFTLTFTLTLPLNYTRMLFSLLIRNDGIEYLSKKCPKLVPSYQIIDYVISTIIYVTIAIISHTTNKGEDTTFTILTSIAVAWFIADCVFGIFFYMLTHLIKIPENEV